MYSIIAKQYTIVDTLCMNHTIVVLMFPLTTSHLYLAADGELRLTEFAFSRWDGSPDCRLHDNARPLLKLRWTAPEVIKSLYFTKEAEVW